MSEIEWDVFLAHAGPDVVAAEELFDYLDGSCRIFLASKSIRLGDDWDTKLAEAQRSSRYSVILVSSTTERAYYQREEIAQAVALARKDAEAHRVVPVYLDGSPDEVSDVPYGLRLKHGIALGGDVTLQTVADRLVSEMTVTEGVGQLKVAPSVSDIWNVPFRRNQFFVGREELLSDLGSRAKSMTPVLALNGMGGVGKTELAIEHAYRQRDLLDVVWWVRAESPSLLAADLAVLADVVGVAVEPEDQEQTARNVVRWFETTTLSWLLVLDNAVEPDSVDPWIPMSGNGQTVVTSRHLTWGEVADPVRVDVFKPEMAINYLLRRTRRDDSEGAARLANGLGYLGLALNQAAGYLNKLNRYSFDHYLASLEAEGLHEVPARGSRHEHTVATLWSESFAQIKAETPLAAELLEMTALCGPEVIPLELFERPIGGSEDVEGWEPAEIDGAVAELSQYSLLEQGLDSIVTVHRLIQLAARNNLDLVTRTNRLAVLYKLLRQRFPTNPEDPATWTECARYAPHIQNATNETSLGPLLSTAPNT
ncbi:MAG: TIR domain-containing protein [bacterium]|nr:TIR domain-containing protein [bacterium]